MALTDTARCLRKNQTDVERILWRHLRNRRILNCKFRRQFPIDPYIVDFVCLELKMVIELDGSQHFVSVEYDKERTSYLELREFKVIRFWNNDVLTNIEGVLEKIRLVIMDRKS